MKKQKKKVKKLKVNLAALKINTDYAFKKHFRNDNRGCSHYHIDNDGSCCHCGESDVLFKLFKGLRNHLKE